MSGNFFTTYKSPAGKLILCSDGNGLSRVWFADNDKKRLEVLKDFEEREDKFLENGCKWLDIYFSNRAPDFMPQLSVSGTDFQMKVWELLLKIPFGHVITYGELSRMYSVSNGNKPMAAQAIGHAVGENHLVIFIPCHRVVGANCHLTGFGEGLDKKVLLLTNEGIDTSKYVP